MLSFRINKGKLFLAFSLFILSSVFQRVYSSPILLQCKVSTFNQLSLIFSGGGGGYFSVLPNPSSGAFQVLLNDKNLIGTAYLKITDSVGNQLLNQSIEVKAGINMYNISDLNLDKGNYSIQIVNGVYETIVVKEVIR